MSPIVPPHIAGARWRAKSKHVHQFMSGKKEGGKWTIGQHPKRSLFGETNCQIKLKSEDWSEAHETGLKLQKLIDSFGSLNLEPRGRLEAIGQLEEAVTVSVVGRKILIY